MYRENRQPIGGLARSSARHAVNLQLGDITIAPQREAAGTRRFVLCRCQRGSQNEILLIVLDQLGEIAGSERAQLRQDVDRFENAGLSGPVVPMNQVEARRQRQHRLAQITKAFDVEGLKNQLSVGLSAIDSGLRAAPDERAGAYSRIGMITYFAVRSSGSVSSALELASLRARTS